MKDKLGSRMKTYESVPKIFLTRRTPIIIRLDGKSFHTFTRGFKKPFDNILIETMWETAKYLCSNIQGCKMAYVQSDEISLFLTDYDNLDTCAWFDNNVQKIVSISASMATLAFNKAFSEIIDKIDANEVSDYIDTYFKRKNTAIFDSRVFTLPKEEVTNYFIWRQGDCSKNSIQMVARANFSHKSLISLNCNQLQEKLFQEKNINWGMLPTYEKRGACIVKETYTLDNSQQTERGRWMVDKDIPLFTAERSYIEKYI
ncbi:MAG: hypothetical protein K0R54_648 [Clostridiaceae bacterium]|jgi:tRNA(His) 5'-end guanylyltransferase|nr:hypothetical protein [Clostridiaceae bacterium]